MIAYLIDGIRFLTNKKVIDNIPMRHMYAITFTEIKGNLVFQDFSNLTVNPLWSKHPVWKYFGINIDVSNTLSSSVGREHYSIPKLLNMEGCYVVIKAILIRPVSSQ